MKSKVLKVLVVLMTVGVMTACGNTETAPETAGNTETNAVTDTDVETAEEVKEFNPYEEYVGNYWSNDSGTHVISNAELYLLLKVVADSQGLTDVGFEELPEDEFVAWVDQKFGCPDYNMDEQELYNFRNSVSGYIEQCTLNPMDPTGDEGETWYYGYWTPDMHEGDYGNGKAGLLDLASNYTYEPEYVFDAEKETWASYGISKVE